jgi:uncharacterized damage-inducible protein DinB
MSELAIALTGESAQAAPSKILEGISEAAAHQKAANAPRTIYEEVWHMAFWQQLSLDWITGNPRPGPASPSEGFPSNTLETWQEIKERFLSGTTAAASIAKDEKSLEAFVLCPNFSGPNRRMTVHDQLVSLVAHNSYHLGRTVLLRQLLGCWASSDSGYSW